MVKLTLVKVSSQCCRTKFISRGAPRPTKGELMISSINDIISIIALHFIGYLCLRSSQLKQFVGFGGEVEASTSHDSRILLLFTSKLFWFRFGVWFGFLVWVL